MTENGNYVLSSTTVKASNIPKFTIEELYNHMDNALGKGTFGTVFAIKNFLNLAVKEIRSNELSHKAMKSLKLELAILPTLSHPGIIKYHQIIEYDTFIYIIMDRYARTLDSMIIKHMRTHTPIPTETLFSILDQVIVALAYLHSAHGVNENGNYVHGIVHRDLKPANILISQDGRRIVLTDFGLCKDAFSNSLTTKAGTPAYMAPESLIHKKTSVASDIWSFGIIVYELVTLSRPNFLNGKEPGDVFINGWKPI